MKQYDKLVLDFIELMGINLAHMPLAEILHYYGEYVKESRLRSADEMDLLADKFKNLKLL